MFSRRGIIVGGIGSAKPSHAWHSAPVDSGDLERVRRWAGEDIDALTADARAAVASALAAADNGGASPEDRLAALRWARTTARRGGTAAERSAARSIIAVLDDSRGSRGLERRVEAALPPTPSPEQADFRAQQPLARSSRPRASARTFRRRRAVALGVVGSVALGVSAVAGARSVFAPPLDATGPPSGAHIGAGALANLAFSVDAGDARWTLDGQNVSARVMRQGRT